MVNDAPPAPAGDAPVAGASCCSMPDVHGLSARQALAVLGRLRLGVRVHGVGLVAGQDPPPGTPVGRDTTAVLHLERHPAAAGESDG